MSRPMAFLDPELTRQLTSSYMPLAAILFTEEIYNAIADNTAKVGTCGHGYTTTGHPVATAVALPHMQGRNARRPGHRPLELGAEANQVLLVAGPGRKLHADWQAVGVLSERQRDRWSTADVHPDHELTRPLLVLQKLQRWHVDIHAEHAVGLGDLCARR